MNKLKKFENKNLEKLKELKKIPNFKPGDIVTVHVKIIEKKRERTQAFEGVCIAKKMQELILLLLLGKFHMVRV